MDEYIGTAPNPKVFVIVHGKGANAGHYGYMMQRALERGLRVIAPDLPHYGMSSPGNVDKSPARTLQDCRAVLYDLIVKQLKVKKAYYHGHSLGGQVAYGYAITYPDAVAGLILEGPAGLEEFPKNVDMGGDKPAPLFDPSYAYDYGKWKEVWDPTEILKGEFAKTKEDILNFYYFKKKNPETGKVEPSVQGYFKRNTEYAQFLTDQRISIINGNKKEYDHHIIAFIRDVYSMGIEFLQEDPKSLYKRVVEIKAPIFIAFGEDEPFIPSTVINGLESLRNDVIVPFYKKMTGVGNKPIIKIYPGSAHFIHTDYPGEYAKDAVDFIIKGDVEGKEAPETLPKVIIKEKEEKKEEKKPGFSK
jgi:pimeloyl-ACP methyl ester carboxylesterase